MKLLNKLNSLVGKPYDAINFHCWHMIEAVIDVPKLTDIHSDTAQDDVDRYIDLFTEVEQPYDGCIVMLGLTHVGIYHSGTVYHCDVLGVRAEAMRNIKYRYNGFKYYEVKK